MVQFTATITVVIVFSAATTMHMYAQLLTVCTWIRDSPSSPFVLLPPHTQACASNSQEPHQVGATLVQQGGLHCSGSGGSVSPPPRLAYLTFSLASTAHQGLGLASSRRFGLCGAVLGFAPVWGWTHGHAPGVPLRLMPVGFASGLWRPAFVLFLFSLPFVFLRGGKRTTRTTIPPQVGPFRRKTMRPRFDLPFTAG